MSGHLKLPEIRDEDIGQAEAMIDDGISQVEAVLNSQEVRDLAQGRDGYAPMVELHEQALLDHHAGPIGGTARKAALIATMSTKP